MKPLVPLFKATIAGFEQINSEEDRLADAAIGVRFFKQNALGAFVNEADVKPIDALRDDVVYRIINAALPLREAVTNFKLQASADFDAFVALSAEQHNLKWGGNKGNITLTSFDGKYRVQKAVDEYVSFNEKLEIAKLKIDSCIGKWSNGSSEHLQQLINLAFKQNKNGQLNTARILSLFQLRIDDDDWADAMAALRDSINPAATKNYMRFYVREGRGDKYKQLAMDFGGL